MFLKIKNNAAGWLRVRVTGAFPERFVNICAQNGVGLWDIERADESTLFVSARARSFSYMAELSRRCMCVPRIEAKKGLPFSTRGIRRRYALLCGVAFFAAALFLMSRIVWTVEIDHTKRVSGAALALALENAGVKTGVFSSSIDSATIKNDLLLQFENLVWITINVKGSRVEVLLREREELPPAFPTGVPCDIIAARDAYINEMNVRNGSAAVKTGQTVLRGDLLVSGHVISENPDAAQRYLHADADITGVTAYGITAKTAQYKYIKRYTGKSITKRSLIIGKIRINLYFNGRIPYTEYDKIITRRDASLTGEGSLPVSLISEKCEEYVAVRVSRTEDELEAGLNAALSEAVETAAGQEGKILSREFRMLEGASAVLRASCEQPLGVKTALVP